MKKDLIIKKSYDISQPLEMIDMSAVLKNHVVKQKLYSNIQGKNYVHTDGWQFAGGLMGLYPRVVSVENLTNDSEIKWKSDVEIVRISDDKVVGRGFAICSSKESKKRTFDEYAILSMSQTRAIGKAYRNLVGWVMKAAGYESTPSEEMPNIINTVVEQKQAVKPQKPIECVNCASIITEAEAKYSQRLFKKNLCRICQATKK
jgi:hypothetical protein